MTSVTKRKQLVNQLRKAHFPFGFDQTSSNQKSQYISKYPGYEIPSNHHQLQQKKNNFSIGSQTQHNPLNPYQSQFKQKYPQHKIQGKQQLLGAKNVGHNNIVFGYQNDNNNDGYLTNYKDQYNKKNAINENNNKKQPLIDNKKRNIDFGDSLTDFTTTYNHVYDKKNVTQNKPINPAELRKSNLMLGNDHNQFYTQNMATYNLKTTANYHAHKPINQQNIQLGSDNVNYTSQNKQKFNYKQSTSAPVEKQMIKDFRSAHFHFGFPQGATIGSSQAQDQYNAKPLQPQPSFNIKSNNINLNIDNNPYYQSSYGKDYLNPGPIQREQPNKSPNNGNILIGTDIDPNQRYLSQAKSNFIPKQISRAQPLKTLGTIQLGQSQGDYRTHNQLTYDNKFPHHQNHKLSVEEINKMKKISIVTGFQGGEYNLHSSQYGKKLGERGMLSKETLDKMKNTNIVLETVPSQLNGKTSYKTSYFYKKNSEF